MWVGAALMALEVQIIKKLSDFTLDVSFATGDTPLSILGASGAGKTMVLRSIAGLERPDQGRIALDGRVLFDAQRRINVPARSRRIGMLFQNYALFPHRTVAENIGFGLHNLRRLNVDTQEEKTILPKDSSGWLPMRPIISPAS